MKSLFESENMEIDKIPGAWVITYWVTSTVTLRLKIQHSRVSAVDHLRAEVRLKPGNEFQVVREFDQYVDELTHPEEYPAGVFDDMPNRWGSEFAMMATKWSRMRDIIEFAGTQVIATLGNQ